MNIIKSRDDKSVTMAIVEAEQIALRSGYAMSVVQTHLHGICVYPQELLSHHHDDIVNVIYQTECQREAR